MQLSVEHAAGQVPFNRFIVAREEFTHCFSLRLSKKRNGTLHHMQYVENSDPSFNGLSSPDEAIELSRVMKLS